MKRGGRGEKLLAAVGVSIEKEWCNIEKPKPRLPGKRAKASSLQHSSAPNYVHLFDAGKWEELDKHLREGNAKMTAQSKDRDDLELGATGITTKPSTLVADSINLPSSSVQMIKSSLPNDSSMSYPDTKQILTPVADSILPESSPIQIMKPSLPNDSSMSSPDTKQILTPVADPILPEFSPIQIMKPSLPNDSSMSSRDTKQILTPVADSILPESTPIQIMKPSSPNDSSMSPYLDSIPTLTSVPVADSILPESTPIQIMKPSSPNDSSMSPYLDSRPTLTSLPVADSIFPVSSSIQMMEPTLPTDSSISSPDTKQILTLLTPVADSIFPESTPFQMMKPSPNDSSMSPPDSKQASTSMADSISDSIVPEVPTIQIMNDTSTNIPSVTYKDSKETSTSIAEFNIPLSFNPTVSSSDMRISPRTPMSNAVQYAVPQSDDESSMSGMSDGSNDFFVPETDDNSSHDSYISDLSCESDHINTEQSSNSHAVNNITCNESENPDITTTFETPHEFHPNVKIRKIQMKSGHRIYDKKQVCLFCKKLFTKLPQHFEHSHSDKKEVCEYSAFPKKSKERLDCIRKLRNKGNYLHNMEVLKKSDGDLIVTRRSKKDLPYTSYLPCQYCFAFMHKSKLWRHAKSCPDRFEQKTKSKSAITNGYLLLPLPENCSKLFNDNILKHMREGEEKSIIKHDKTLCTFGSKQAVKHKFLPQLKNQISFKLRLLARLRLIHLKNKREKIKKIISSAKHLVMKENFYIVASAVHEMSVDAGTPSLGKKLGHHLKKIAMIVRNQSIVEGDDVLRNNIEDFLVLFNDEWDTLVSGPANDVLNRRRYKKKIELPSTEDIMRLNRFIISKEKEFIMSNFKDVTYTELTKVILTHLVVFNRRRVGEVSLMELSSYNNRSKAEEPQGEIEKMLSQSEVKMFSDLEIVYLRGKKGAKVDCLLTPDMVKCLDHLVAIREKNGVLKENIYLFCLPFSQHCIRGSEAIKEMADKCGATLPSQLTSTKLRKHISTVSQLLNLSENNFNALCKHMGHNPSVHRQYYQMPEETILKTQISKILLTLEQGNITKYQGKKLSDFEVPLTATTDSTSDSEEDETNTLNDWNGTSAGGNDFDTNLFSNTDNFNDGPDMPTPPECEKAEKKKKKKKTDNFNDNSGYRPSSNERKPTAKPTLPLQSPFFKNSVKKKIIRVQWSKEEMDILNAFFAEEIILGKRPPTKKRCEELINKYPQFQGRGNYLKIKWRVNAIIQERRKKLL